MDAVTESQVTPIYPGERSGIAEAVQNIDARNWVPVSQQLLVLARSSEGLILSGSEAGQAGILASANGYAALRSWSGAAAVSQVPGHLEVAARFGEAQWSVPGGEVSRVVNLLGAAGVSSEGGGQLPEQSALTAFAAQEKIAASPVNAASTATSIGDKTGALADLLSVFDDNGQALSRPATLSGRPALKVVSDESASPLATPVANALTSMRHFDANGQQVLAPSQEAVPALKSAQPSLLDSLKHAWLAQTK